MVFKTLSGNQNIFRRWESEVSPKIIPAPFFAFPAVAQGRWSRWWSQEGISRLSELRIQDDQGSWSSKEMREFYRERILEMFRVPSRIQLSPAHGVSQQRRLEKEPPGRTRDYSTMPSLTQNQNSAWFLPPARLGNLMTQGTLDETHGGVLPRSWGLISPKWSTVLLLPNTFFFFTKTFF